MFDYLVIELNGAVYLRQRKEKDIWQNLYEFVLIELTHPITGEAIVKASFLRNIFGKKIPIKRISAVYSQQLTHQTILAQFIHISGVEPVNLKGYQAFRKKTMMRNPFPKTIADYLEKEFKQ